MKQQQKKDWVPKVIAAVCGLAVLGGMALAGHLAQQKGDADAPSSMPETLVSEQVAENGTLSLLAVGDHLISDTMLQAALQADNTYDFSGMYAPVESLLSSADLAVLNQESVLAGDQLEISGYPPLYNSPYEVGQAAATAGFQVFLCANEHVMDRGEQGIESAISFFEQQKNITYLGIHKDAAAARSVQVVIKNGIKIALLNYTFGINGIELPEDKPWLVSQLEQEQMAQDIAAAREQADVVAVFPHWGNEYTSDVSTAQREMAQFFCDNGVDLVIGSHPHMVQPVEWLESETGKRTLVYYSLGNFLAHENGVDRMLGAAAQITITKEDGVVAIEGEVVPLVNHITHEDDGWTFQVYPLKDYTDTLAAAHKESSLSVEYLEQQARAVFGDFQAE